MSGGSRVRYEVEGQKRAQFVYSPLSAAEVIAVMVENYSKYPNTTVTVKGNKLTVSGTGGNFVATAKPA